MDTILDLDELQKEAFSIDPPKPAMKPSSYEDLLDYIDQTEAEEYEPEDVFNITSEEQANYYVRQYKSLQKELDNIEESRKTAIEKYTNKVDTWVESVSKPIQYKMEYYSSLLERYAVSRLENSKSRSLKLIEGNIGFRKVQPSFERNDGELRDYINSLGDDGKQFLVEQDPKIDWSKLKKSGSIQGDHFIYNGKPVPGVIVTQKPDAFGVK